MTCPLMGDPFMQLIPMAIGTEKHEIFYQYGAQMDRKAAKNDSELLEKAEKIGADLVVSTK
ncbi:MAG: hypothetical protein JRE58_05275 [Deltaproteobacteria bacterium]|nr:hypothetical protein [Deltaproteobacteria bacterium]